MKVLSAAQLQELDQSTITNEPITSVDLMERAARQCANWIMDRYSNNRNITVVTGQGNNGGDGLVIARLLHQESFEVDVLICQIGNPSVDFASNLERLAAFPDIEVQGITPDSEFMIPKDTIVVDAIFGYGLNRPISSPWDAIIDQINSSDVEIISIDLPSGVFPDQPTESISVHADHTLTFATPKLAFFIPENQTRIGKWHVLPIGLDKAAYNEMPAVWQTLRHGDILSMLKPRAKYDHKGVFGHAFLVVGSFGKIGAAILAAQAALRSGVGLLTVHVPRKAYEIMQVAVPEAMVQTDRHDENFSGLDVQPAFTALGIGCGIGTSDCTVSGMRDLLKDQEQAMVIDADGLNVIAQNPELIEHLPPYSILTPHLKEFARMFGESQNHFERLQKALKAATEHQVIIVVKGAHTAVALPSGTGYFNTTGNPGMATAGSGDVLTGIMTGLLAQDYSPEETALLGTYLHGLSGDLAARAIGEEALVAGDIVEHLGKAYQSLHGNL